MQNSVFQHRTILKLPSIRVQADQGHIGRARPCLIKNLEFKSLVVKGLRRVKGFGGHGIRAAIYDAEQGLGLQAVFVTQDRWIRVCRRLAPIPAKFLEFLKPYHHSLRKKKKKKKKALSTSCF